MGYKLFFDLKIMKKKGKEKMKKIIAGLLLLILSVAAMAGQIKHEYKFEKPEIINGKVFIKGCDRINIPFVPAVAVKQVKLLLPNGEKASSFDISYAEPIILEGEFEIAPVAASGRLSVTPPTGIEEKKGEVFSQNSFFPEKVKSAKFFTQYKNGHPVFMTVLNPVQYNPITKQLKMYQKITLTVNTENSIKGLDNLKKSADLNKYLTKYVDNPDQIINSGVDVRDATDYDYLIITTEQFSTEFSDFSEFNIRRGLKTEIHTVEDIKLTTAGNDDQDKIRNFIKQQYNDHGISYVLLGGDDEFIPHRGFRAEIMDYGTDYYDEKDIPADMYYGCLDGTWQKEGSSQYGEPGSEDLLYEVYVSRFAVDSKEELENIIHKTIQYSENPVGDQVVNNLLAGEFLWGENQQPGWIDSYGMDCMEEMRGTVTANGYTTTGFSPEWNTSTLYEKEAAWGASELFDKVNNENISWIDHLGHSNVTYNMHLSNYQVTDGNFLNNGVNSNYFIVYSQGCYSGSFDNRNSSGYIEGDCIGEKFTTISNGAVAYIGNSRYGLGSPFDTDGSGQRFHRYFHHAAFGEEIWNIEKMNAFSKEINAPFILEEDINQSPYFGQCRWIAYCVNVLGDPALDVWTSVPAEIEVDFPANVTLNNNEPITISTGIEDATVVLRQGDELFIKGKTNSSGEFVCTLSPLAEGEVDLFVSKHNFLTTTKKITVLPNGIEDDNLVTSTQLYQNYPNPFNPTTSISYNLKKAANITLTVYNTNGEEVVQLVNREMKAGLHQVNFNGSKMTSGVYFYNLIVDGQNIGKRKMMLLK